MATPQSRREDTISEPRGLQTSSRGRRFYSRSQARRETTLSQARSEDETQMGYDSNFEPELDKKYQCPICLLAFREPVQTKCGHRFCKICLHGVHEGMRYCRCPVDKQWFDTVKDVFDDTAVKREVMSLLVSCKNTTTGCEWKGELRDEEGHGKVCLFEIVPCDNEQCPEKGMLRSELQEHLKVCSRRRQSCQHCGMGVVAADFVKHQLMNCSRFPVSCNVCAQTGILREDIPRHIDPQNGDCPLVTIACAFANIGCQYMDKRKNMNDHYAEAGHKHMILVTNQLLANESKLRLTEQELKATKEQNITFMQHFQDQAALLSGQQLLLNNQAELIKHLETTSYCGKLLWKVNVLEEDSQPRIVSPSLYTGRPGYKICVALEVTGFKENNESYASLFVILEKGMNDRQLKFPFDGYCNITVFDQSEDRDERQNLSVSVVCHQVPRVNSEEHISASTRSKLKFMTTDELLNGRFNKNGVMFIQIDVNHCIPPEVWV